MSGLGAMWRIVACLAVLALSACGSTFSNSYDSPVPASVSQNWRVVDVDVVIPNTLVVSEAKTIFPSADIVWREDPEGDRRAQVAKIISDAAFAATASLRGPRPVVIQVTLQRFHALTFEAEARLSKSGVHDIRFVARVLDQSTGAVLAGPEQIEASLPALSGADMVAARARGETQKSQISANLRRVFAGWLGTGPDARRTFNRIGG